MKKRYERKERKGRTQERMKEMRKKMRKEELKLEKHSKKRKNPIIRNMYAIFFYPDLILFLYNVCVDY